MAKLYAVTAGEYSGYHIITCTTDKQRAENIAKIYDGIVEEYEDSIIDENIPWWIVRSYNMTSAGVEDGMAELNLDGADYITNDCFIYDFRKDSGYCVIYVKAPTEEKACKIAQDEFFKFCYQCIENESVPINGHVLNFGKVDKLGCYFPSDCHITWADKVPVCIVMIDKSDCKNRIAIGSCEVEQTSTGLIMHGVISGAPNFDAASIRNALNNGENLYFGGYYRVLEQSDEDRDKKIYRNLRLLAIDILTEGTQADDNLKVCIE